MKRSRTNATGVSDTRIIKTRDYITWFLHGRGCVDYEDIANQAVEDALSDIEKGYGSADFFEVMVRQRAGKHAKKLANRQLGLPLYPKSIEDLYQHLVDSNLKVKSAEEEYFAQKAMDIVIEAVNRLPYRLKFVIMNEFFFGLSQEQSASVLKCSDRTIRRDVKRALACLSEDEELRAFFQEYCDSEA